MLVQSFDTINIGKWAVNALTGNFFSELNEGRLVVEIARPSHMTRPALCRRAQPRGASDTLTDVGASAQGERDAEAFEPAVRFQHHVGGGIVRVRVLQG